MKLLTLKKKLLKEDPIFKLYYNCQKDNGKIDEDKLEKYLKRLVKQGKLLN